MKWIAAMTITVSLNAQAEFFTGNELLSKMNSQSTVDQTFAMGYVTGVSDAVTNVTACPPRHATIGQVLDLVKAHLTNNPSQRHYTADSLISNLLQKTWPCAPRGRTS